jgi:PAS domain S-box-containing protein
MSTASEQQTSSEPSRNPPHRGAGRHWLAGLACLLLFTPGGEWGQAARAADASAGEAQVRVGSEIEFPPYAILDEKGQPAGFSVDLLRAVARAAGLDLRFTAGPWDQVWRGLVAGDLDVLPIVAISDERRRLVDFGLPHTETFDAFFVRRGDRDIPDLRAAEGKTIGVMRSDAAHHELVERGFRGRIELVDTIPEGLAQVAAGKTDAFLCSKLVGVLSMQAQGIRGLVAGPPIPDYKRVFAFGLRKGASELKERLDQGLLTVKVSGEYDRIYARWLSYDDPWRRIRPYLPAALALLGLGAVLATIAVASQRRRTRFLRSILETAQDGFWMLDSSGRILLVNDATCALSGYRRKELLEMTVADLEVVERPEDVKAHLDRVAGAGSERFLTRHRRKDGTLIDVEVSVQAVPRMRGRAVAFLRDITERKRGEAALRESEAQHRLLVDNLNAGVVVHGPDTRILLANAKAGLLLGLTLEQMRGRDALDPGWRFVRDDGTAMPQEEYPVARVFATGEPVVDQVIGVDRPATGDRVWVLANAYPDREAPGRPNQVVVTFVDITERKRAEELLRESEKTFRDLFERNSATGLIIDPDNGIIIDANQAAANYYGWSRDRLRQMRIQEINTLSPAEAEQKILRARTEGSVHFEFRHRMADGSIRDVDAFTSKVEIHGRDLIFSIILDSTARKQAEAALGVAHAQLALTSRLAALGTLVAGVAHEINNPLAATLSDQELAREAVREVRDHLRGSGPVDREVEVRHLDEVVEELDDAQEAGRRIARIVKDLRTFGRPNQTRTRTRLGDIVDLAMRWVPLTVAQTATVIVENEGAPDVMASPGQLEQVVVNLITNAANATQEGARGAIVVRIGAAESGAALLEVIDRGKGMDPAVMARIFEPFFTTRDLGKGMGLGLSICHAIVTNHGGTLTATSEVGKGSTFRVELPAATAEA